MKEKQKKESKQQIQSLAELAINKIYENKFLEEQKERYTKQINFIKNILINNSKLENNDNSKKNLILMEKIKDFYNSLVSSNYDLEKEKKKLYNKLSSYKDDLLNDHSINKQSLTNIQLDNLLLTYQLKEKDDIIKALNKSIESQKDSKYFKESKREVSTNNKWGEYYLQVNLNNTSEKMMLESQNFISFNNKCYKKENEKNKINEKKKYFNDVIKYFESYLYKNSSNDENISSNIIKNNNNKNFRDKKSYKEKKMLTKTMILTNDNELSLFDQKEDNLFGENLLIDEEKKKAEEKYDDADNNITNIQNNIYTSVLVDNQNYESLFKYYSQDMVGKNNKNSNKNKKRKINFLTVDELFDVNNHEGKSEAIIDDELHSDDEIVFEKKIKPLKKISIHYMPKIKGQVPKINLSQIEFNKKKVMNEADLYIMQRRKFQMDNVYENIRTMKKKIKKIKHICKTNKKKVNAFEKYAKNMESNYKVLKPLKIQSSLGGAKIPKIQNFFHSGGGNHDMINEIDDIDLGDDDSDDLGEEDFEYNTNNTETNIKRKISISDKDNIHVKNKYSKMINEKSNIEKKVSGKKVHHSSNNRANSK